MTPEPGAVNKRLASMRILHNLDSSISIAVKHSPEVT
jgi:hypothetical protein